MMAGTGGSEAPSVLLLVPSCECRKKASMRMLPNNKWGTRTGFLGPEGGGAGGLDPGSEGGGAGGLDPGSEGGGVEGGDSWV